MLLNIFLWCFAFPISLVLIFNRCTRKYKNPYKLTFIFGKKGSGKSTLMTKFALEYMKKGWSVYSTDDIPGTYKISHEDIGVKEIPPNSLVLIGEVGTIWHKRNFKNFPEHVRRYFKFQRKYRHRVIMDSQTFDVDAGIRDLADEMYLVTSKFRVFSYAKRISKKVVLVEATAEGESRIAENLEFEPFLWCLFGSGSRKLTFVPRYVRYFTSFDPPPLQPAEYKKLPELPPKKRIPIWRATWLLIRPSFYRILRRVDLCRILLKLNKIKRRLLSCWRFVRRWHPFKKLHSHKKDR